MSDEQEAMTLDIARRVLNEPSASDDRRQRADDVIRALEFGDTAAARRIGLYD